jgi:hypothetical protein
MCSIIDWIKIVYFLPKRFFKKKLFSMWPIEAVKSEKK